MIKLALGLLLEAACISFFLWVSYVGAALIVGAA